MDLSHKYHVYKLDWMDSKLCDALRKVIGQINCKERPKLGKFIDADK
jgi:hypothetical protein